MNHGTHGTGKLAKKIPVRENTGNLEILSKHREFCLSRGKTQGILLAQVVNVLILKVKDIAIVAAKNPFFPEAGLCPLAQGKFAVGQGKHMEFENTI